MAAFAICALYVLGALAVFSSFVQGGFWPGANRLERGVMCVNLMIWPLFILCQTFTTVRALTRRKEQRAQAAQKGQA